MFGKDPLGSSEFDNVKILRQISERHRGESWNRTKRELKEAGVLPRPEIDTNVDAIGELIKKIPNYVSRREVEVDNNFRPALRNEYLKFKRDFTRLGRKPFKEDVFFYLGSKLLIEKYTNKDFFEEMEEKRFRGLMIILRSYLKRKYGDCKPQRSQDKYGNCIFDFEAWQHVLTINLSLDNKYPLPLFEQAKEAVGYALFDKAKELRLDKKNGFFLALTVYSIRKLEKVDGCRYLKTEEEIINAFDVPRSTFKRMMTELYRID